MDRGNRYLTADRLIHNRWFYGFKDGGILTDNFLFETDGRIAGYAGAYEKTWQLDDGSLKIYDASKTHVLDFDLIAEEDERVTLIARHPSDPTGLLHVYLREGRLAQSKSSKTPAPQQRGPLKDSHGRFRIAVITMVYNESFFLPIWKAYYGAQIGTENLFVIDHGSDDGSITPDIMNVIRLPRDRFVDETRSKMIAELHQSLLNYYDVVIYTDCDEILVARPGKYASLPAYLQSQTAPIIRCVGINVVPHEMGLAPLDLSTPLLRQRPYGFATHWYFKPLVSAVPIRWVPGFHDCDNAATFDPDLWMFHLKLIDIENASRQRPALADPAQELAVQKKADSALRFLRDLQTKRSDETIDAPDLHRYFENRLSGDVRKIPEEFLDAI